MKVGDRVIDKDKESAGIGTITAIHGDRCTVLFARW